MQHFAHFFSKFFSKSKITPYIRAMKDDKKQIQICVSDLSGELQTGIDECARLIKEKQPEFIDPAQFRQTQNKQNKSSIVRIAVDQLIKKLESC